MRKPSSGIDIGLWAVGGLVGLYLLGGVVLIADVNILKTHWIYQNAPSSVQRVIETLYRPLGQILDRLLGPPP